MDSERRQLMEEAYRRHLKQSAGLARFAACATALEATCHPKQRKFVTATDRLISLLTPRRSGKTKGNVRRLRRRSLLTKHRGGVVRYWGISRLRAKQLAWDELKDLDRRIGLREGEDVEYHDTELTSTLSNGVKFFLLGADKPKEAEKKRGDAVIEDLVDECQLFAGYLDNLFTNVVLPSLADLKGTGTLSGTPGPVCAGFWHEVSATNVPKRSPRAESFTRHSWSAKDNTFRPDLWAEFLDLKEKMGWDDNHPTWVREYIGDWVEDAESLFYAFNPNKNLYTPGEEFKPEGPGWCHAIGWDLGADDDMALVVWGYHPKKRNLYEAFSWKRSGVSMDELDAILKSLDKRFNLESFDADTGGLGKAYVLEFAKRYGWSFQAAKKANKHANVSLLSDDLRAGRVFLAEGSPYADEISVLPKDPDWDPREHDGKPAPEDPRYPNHCADAGLYSYVRAYHYLHEEEPERPKPGSPEEFDEWNARVIAARERRVRGDEDNWIGADDAWGDE